MLKRVVSEVPRATSRLPKDRRGTSDDGGRVRIRTPIETTKRKGVKHRRKIRVEWREPKRLILDLSGRKGRMLRGTRPRIDGTMSGPDHLMELLAFHLHRFGAARAEVVSFVSDGVPWIS